MAGPTLVAWAARACLVLASACAFAFVAGGLWQAGALIDYFAQASGPPPRAVPATRGALPGRSEPPKPKPKPEPTLSPASSDVTVTSPPVAAAVTFEVQAVASEKVIPVGLEAAADDEEYELVLGEAPPPGYPRTSCDDVFVYIVTLAEGAPERSAASLGIGKSSPARLRLPGEKIGDWTVLAITDDSTGINPDVWLEKNGAACSAELAGNPARVAVATKPRVKKAKKKKKKRRRRKRKRR